MDAVIQRYSNDMMATLWKSVRVFDDTMSRLYMVPDTYQRPSADEFLTLGVHLVPVKSFSLQDITQWSSAIPTWLSDYWNTQPRTALTPRYTFVSFTDQPVMDESRTKFPNARQNHIVYTKLERDSICHTGDILALAVAQQIRDLFSDDEDYRTHGVFLLDPHLAIADGDAELFNKFTMAFDMMAKYLGVPVYFVVRTAALRDKRLRPFYHRRKFAKTLGYCK